MKRFLTLIATSLVLLTGCEDKMQPQSEKKEFSASLKTESLVLKYDVPATLDYTLQNQDGSVSVDVKDLPSDVSFKNTQPSSSSGTLEFRSKLDENKTVKVQVVFKDNNTTITKDLSLQIEKKEVKAPSAIETDVDSPIVYQFQDLMTEIGFTVTCDSGIEEVVCSCEPGLVVETAVADDKRSGKITVKATEQLGTSSKVKITASNAGGSIEKEIEVQKAYLDLNHESFQVGYKGTETQYVLTVSTNLSFEVNVMQNEDFVTATKYGNDVLITVKENPSMTMRTATVEIQEPQNRLSKSAQIMQAGAEGDNASDRAALIAIYDALNMKEWIDYGSGGYYYKNWCTDEPMDKWLGVELTGYNGEGRVWQIALLAKQPNSTGYIPEELGQLTKLREFSIYPGHRITHLPESIKNLVNLRRLSFYDDIIDMDLSEWKGLTELMNNPKRKLEEFCFAGTGLHGTIPEWISTFSYDGQFSIEGCHFSGQVPESVAKAGFWSKVYCYPADDLEACPRFDKTKYKITEDGWYYEVPQGEAMMYLQADNYALWVGERPSNTKWVDDKFGGHWEWTE